MAPTCFNTQNCFGILTTLIALIVMGCGHHPSSSSLTTTRSALHQVPFVIRKIESHSLHNFFQISTDIYSGSSPEGQPAFMELNQLGVRTIISVDGAKPDVVAAKRHGMNYIHIPFGYDAVPRDKLLAFTLAAETVPRPIYVHCHHGKHRGPTAVAVMQLCTDPSWNRSKADDWLKLAGTDPKYRGLVSIPSQLIKPTRAEIEQASIVLPSVAFVSDFTQMMVQIDQHWGNIKLSQAVGWKTPENHPDIEPAHEAILLAELYR